MISSAKFIIGFVDIKDVEPGTQAHSGECRQSQDGSALPNRSSKPDFFILVMVIASQSSTPDFFLILVTVT